MKDILSPPVVATSRVTQSVGNLISAKTHLRAKLGGIASIPCVQALDKPHTDDPGEHLRTIHYLLGQVATIYGLGACPIEIVSHSNFDFAYGGKLKAVYDPNMDHIFIRDDSTPVCVSLGVHELFERWLHVPDNPWSAEECHKAALFGQAKIAITSRSQNLIKATRELILEAEIGDKDALKMICREYSNR